MFSSRRLLSLGLRMTLQHLQDGITNMQSLQNATLFAQRKNFSLSKIFKTELSQKLPLENTNTEESPKQKLAEIQGQLQLSFTCKKCQTRNFNKIISKIAYEKGVVIVRCNGCQSNHLIADNLNWFEGTHSRNIEMIMKKKGEKVRRLRDNHDGYFEALANEEFLRIQSLMKEQNVAEGLKSVEEAEELIKVQYEKVGEPQNN